MTNTNYKVNNPSAGNDYFDTAGVAVGSDNQPNVLGGSAKGLYSNRALLDNVSHGINVGVHGSQVVYGLYVGSAAWTGAISITSVAASGGFAVYTLAAHGRAVGDVINVQDTNSVVDGTQKITAVASGTFTTDKLYISGVGILIYRSPDGCLAFMTAGSYVIRRVTTTLANLAKTTLQSGGSDYGIRRSIHKLEAMRTLRVATAIRAGYWNFYSATWSTQPTNANDISTWGTDEAATPSYAVPGELVYKTSKPAPVQDNYEARTN